MKSFSRFQYSTVQSYYL